MSSIAIGSLFGGICCLGLSITPIPFQQYAMLRCAGALGALGCFSLGHCEAQKQKKLQAEFDRHKQIEEQRQEEMDELERRNREAIEQGKREALVIEARRKEEARIAVALADYTDDVQDAYVVIQDEKGRLDRVLARLQPEPEPKQVALPEPELLAIAEDVKHKKESFAAKKTKLLKFLKEHEGGWILKILKKPLLIYGGQGSGKSYFAEFVALCRYYLRDHQIVSIADPHWHQNKDECWQHLVKLGVPGYGAHHNYAEVNSQLLSMYDSFAVRTLKSQPETRIFDEITGYKREEETREAAAKLGSKLSSDVRKANCSPIIIAHGITLEILGGADGFAEAINENFVKVKLNSNDEQEPLWRGTVSGIKDEDGETMTNMKISIAPDWIRSSWIYNLFEGDGEENEMEVEEVSEEVVQLPKTEPETQTNNRKIFLEEGRKWLRELYDESSEVEVEVTSGATPWDDTPEVRYEAPEVRDIRDCGDTSEITSLLPEEVRSKALTKILALLREAGSASDEVISLIPAQPDRAVWIGIKLLKKSMTATSRDIFSMGVGGAKFKIAKKWYESLKKEFDS